MIFGLISMILEGFSWIVWGFVGGEAPRRKLNMGLIVAVSALVAILICLVGIGVVSVCESRGIMLHKVVHPAIPEIGNKNIQLITLLYLIAGIFNFAQLQFMSKAMKYGPNGIVWSIIQVGFIAPFIIGILFFKEPLTWAFAAATLLVIAALVIFAVTADNSSKGNWLLMAIISFAATCVCQSMQYIPSNIDRVKDISSIWRTMSFFVGMLAGFGITCICSKAMRSEIMQMIKSKFTWFYALLIDVVVVLTSCCLLYPGLDALAAANAGAISMQLMTASGIVSFELYALLILKEKRKFMQFVALLLCLASIVVICF